MTKFKGAIIVKETYDADFYPKLLICLQEEVKQ